MAPPNNSEADVRRRPQVGEIPPLASYSPKGNETATAKKIVPSAPFAAVWEKPTFTLKDVRDAIPAHCFKRDNLTSFSYVFKDLAMVLALWYAATWISSLPTAAQYIAWPAYWWAQGAVATGVWVIAHECGHQGFSESATINNVTGYILHSLLLVPYFSWKITHSKHHKANAHMTKDTVHVPNLRSDYDLPPRTAAADHHHDEPIIEAAPLWDLIRIARMLFLGWPAHLLFNVSGQRFPEWTSHFRPDAPIFEPKQWFQVVLSDIGMLVMIGVLAMAGQIWGSMAVIKYYVMPYFLVNMWLVMITFLQHTDAKVPHFRNDEWNFLLGALSTVDRDYGMLNYFFHHIGDTHVAHHLFSTMPHYHAEEATEHIKRAVGKYYLRDDTNIWKSLWKSYTECRFVEETGDVLWFKQ